LFGNITQDFNTKGVGLFSCKIGYRSPFRKLDSLEFNFQSPLSNFKRKYYNFGIDWMNPIHKFGTSHVKVNCSNESAFKDIDVKSKGISFLVNKDNYTLELETAHR
jgi:hypothetical protein